MQSILNLQVVDIKHHMNVGPLQIFQGGVTKTGSEVLFTLQSMFRWHMIKNVADVGNMGTKTRQLLTR